MQVSLRIILVLLFAVVALAPTYECGGDNSTEDEAEDLTDEQRCRRDCDALYGCAIALPDDQTGVPLSLPQCRAGCGEDPGNVGCVDQCVEDFYINDSCGDLEACVSDVCGVPIISI